MSKGNKLKVPQVSGDLLNAIKKEKKLGKKSNCPFLKGPIPIHWLASAKKASPTALSVGLYLWHLSGLTKKKTFKATNRTLPMWRLDRYAKYRGLKELEKSGLIKVKRQNKNSPEVTILNGNINTSK
jgi:hypothetical protein